jgi:hypothetical protein
VENHIARLHRVEEAVVQVAAAVVVIPVEEGKLRRVPTERMMKNLNSF